MTETSTPERRVPRQARSRAKVERILAAATELLAREGAEAFNTNRIATEAGVGVGSLYEYFPDKGAILEQIVDQISNRESEAVLELLSPRSDRPLVETIEVVVRRLVELYHEHHALYRALRGVTTLRESVGQRPAERLVLSEIRAQLVLHQRHLPDIDPDRAAFTLFHLVESLAFQMIDQVAGDWTREQCTEEIIRAARGYLGI